LAHHLPRRIAALSVRSSPFAVMGGQVDFRRSMLGNNPRLRAALDLVAEKSGWGQPLPPRTGRGVSAQSSFGSFVATVVEAEVDDHGEVHLRRVTSAVDTGIAVNPDTIAAQLQGGLIFGLTAALFGEITIMNGRVQQSNFNDYRMLRIDEAPPIDVHVIESGEDPGGIGETGVAAGPPALRVGGTVTLHATMSCGILIVSPTFPTGALILEFCRRKLNLFKGR
jgi:CO/xanthine dehydrogenase Mo-binding subunit